MIGLCLEKRGLDEEAHEAYDAALARNPLDIAARWLHDPVLARLENRAGESLAARNEWRDALGKFQRASSLDARNAAAAENVGLARRHIRHEDGAAAVQRIVNGLVVEVQAPTPSSSVAFQIPAETAYAPPDRSTPVPVGGRIEQAVLAAPPAAAAESAGRAPTHLHLHLESAVLLANPLNAAQTARDRELMKPLDERRLMALPPEDVAAHLRDRFEAAARQIPIASTERFEEEIRKLQAAGTIPPGDNLLGAMRADPRVAAEVNRILRQVAEQERPQVAQAARESIENMVHYLAGRDQYVRDHAAQLLQTIQQMKADELKQARDQAERELNAAYREAEQLLRTNPEALSRMTGVYAGIRARLAQKSVEVHLRYIRYAADIAGRMKEGTWP